MTKYEILGLLLIKHNQCEDQFSELGKLIDKISQLLMVDLDIDYTLLAEIKLKSNILLDEVTEYNHLIDEIIEKYSSSVIESEPP